MKIIRYPYIYVFFLCLIACSSHSDMDYALEILSKKDISEAEYSELLELYESGVDDAADFAAGHHGELSAEDQKYLVMVLQIGKRLALDEEKLTQRQNKEFLRITQKGTENFAK